MLTVRIPPMVPFNHPILTDWIWMYLRKHKREDLVTFNRLTGQIMFEIPSLPRNLIETIEEVGGRVERVEAE